MDRPLRGSDASPNARRGGSAARRGGLTCEPWFLSRLCPHRRSPVGSDFRTPVESIGLQKPETPALHHNARLLVTQLHLTPWNGEILLNVRISCLRVGAKSRHPFTSPSRLCLP